MQKLKLALYMIEVCEDCEVGKAKIGRKISNLVKHAPRVGISEVICQDQVEPALIQKAMDSGADGVLIFGCHPEQCWFKNKGSSKKRIPVSKKLLALTDSEDLSWSESSNLKVARDTIWKN